VLVFKEGFFLELVGLLVGWYVCEFADTTAFCDSTNNVFIKVFLEELVYL
jgi:hypothetical protein